MEKRYRPEGRTHSPPAKSQTSCVVARVSAVASLLAVGFALLLIVDGVGVSGVSRVLGGAVSLAAVVIGLWTTSKNLEAARDSREAAQIALETALIERDTAQIERDTAQIERDSAQSEHVAAQRDKALMAAELPRLRKAGPRSTSNDTSARQPRSLIDRHTDDSRSSAPDARRIRGGRGK
jgi:uncharacterized protein (DUF3084 family)